MTNGFAEKDSMTCAHGVCIRRAPVWRKFARERIGICFGVLLVFLSFFGPDTAVAKIEETSSIGAAVTLIETFEEVCSDQVESGLVGDKSDLIALTDDQISGLASVLGFKVQPDAIWSNDVGDWYQVQVSVDAPDTCLFVTFQITLDHMKTAWNAQFSKNDDWQLLSEAVIEENDPNSGETRSRLTGAYVLRPHEGRVIVAGASGLQLQETGMIMLRYQKTEVSTDATGTTEGDR